MMIGVSPNILYGTAWKKEETGTLVSKALRIGYRGFDTAAQPENYCEDLVGDAIRDAIRNGIIARQDVYIQTKFSPKSILNDSKLSLERQVQLSVAQSLKNLRSGDEDQLFCDQSYVDCMILHEPLRMLGDTLEIWKALEAFVPHSVKSLGISNITSGYLEVLYPLVKVKPSVVQNPFIPDDFDVEVRKFCRLQNINYQPYWVLKKCHELLSSEPVIRLSKAISTGTAASLLGLLVSLGNITVLSGTWDEKHMIDDLAAVKRVSSWKDSGEVSATSKEWTEIISQFNKLVEEN